jgi:hypothetical protein
MKCLVMSLALGATLLQTGGCAVDEHDSSLSGAESSVDDSQSSVASDPCALDANGAESPGATSHDSLAPDAYGAAPAEMSDFDRMASDYLASSDTQMVNGGGAAGNDGNTVGAPQTEPGVRFFSPTGNPRQDGSVGALCGQLAYRTAVAANFMGAGDQDAAFRVRMAEHVEGLRRLRAMFPNQEGFFSGIWSYSPEQLQQAGVEIQTFPGWRNRNYRVIR